MKGLTPGTGGRTPGGGIGCVGGGPLVGKGAAEDTQFYHLAETIKKYNPSGTSINTDH